MKIMGPWEPAEGFALELGMNHGASDVLVNFFGSSVVWVVLDGFKAFKDMMLD
jgi:hypothetical protein